MSHQTDQPRISRRKFILTATASVGAVALASCAQPATPSPSPTKPSTAIPQTQPTPATSGQKVEISYYHHYSDGQRKTNEEEMVRLFEQRNPNVKVKVTIIGGINYMQGIKVVMAGGEAPDVLYNWIGGRTKAFADAGLLMKLNDPIKKYGWDKKIYPWMWQRVTEPNGDIWTIPTTAGADFMFYNKEIFAKHDIAIPTTWNDMIQSAEKLKKAGVTPFILGNKTPNWGSHLFSYLFYNIVGLEKGRDMLEGRQSLNNPGLLESLELLKEWTSKYFNPAMNAIDWPDGEAQFFAGQAAMKFFLIRLLGDARTQAPAFIKKMGYFKAPPIKKEIPSVQVGDVLHSLNVSAKAKLPYALDFVNWEVSDEGNAVKVKKTGSASSNKDAKIDPEDAEDLAQMITWFQDPDMRWGGWADVLLDPGLSDKTVVPGLASVIGGDRTPKQLFDEIVAAQKTIYPNLA